MDEEYENFEEVLKETIRMIKGKRGVSKEEKIQMLARLKEIREKRNQ